MSQRTNVLESLTAVYPRAPILTFPQRGEGIICLALQRGRGLLVWPSPSGGPSTTHWYVQVGRGVRKMQELVRPSGYDARGALAVARLLYLGLGCCRG